jgi:serine/threonine protein kinase
MISTQDILQKGAHLQNGKYTVERVLGQGGFGITYLAQHSLFGQVALKELFLNHAAQMYCTRQGNNVLPKFDSVQFEGFKAKFLDEARTLARFKDIEGIVKVLDYFEENGTAYFSMEYIDGQTLEDLVETKKAQHGGFMKEPDALAIIGQVGKALSVVHEQGILHRDIKPANILLNTQTQRATLIDFGIARSFIEGSGAGQTAFFSEGFSAPELKLVNLAKGTYTDVYSLGSMLFYCLTGQPAQAADQREMEGFKSPKYLNPSVSKVTNEAIVKAIQLRPSERPVTVQEFLNLLSNKMVTPKHEQTLPDLPTPKKSEVTINDNLVSEKPRAKSEKTIVDEEDKAPLKEVKIEEVKATPPPPITPRPIAKTPPPVQTTVYNTSLFGYLKFRNESALQDWYKALGIGAAIIFLTGISLQIGANVNEFIMAVVFGALAKVAMLYFAFQKWFAKKPYLYNSYDTVLYVGGLGLGMGLGGLLALFVFPAESQQLVLFSLLYHTALGVILGKGISEADQQKPYMAMAPPLVIDGCATYLTNIALLVYLGAIAYGAWLFHQQQTKATA